MSDLEARIAGEPRPAAEGATVTWLDRATGLARLATPDGSRLVVIEGAGSNWFVTLRGRRIPVTVRSWRERILAEADVAARAQGGPIDVAATLPGMVAAVTVAEGDRVVEGQSLLTVEAMKMQNEVRAPRAGVVGHIAVEAGTTVATGALLVRLEEIAEPAS